MNNAKGNAQYLCLQCQNAQSNLPKNPGDTEEGTWRILSLSQTAEPPLVVIVAASNELMSSLRRESK